MNDQERLEKAKEQFYLSLPSNLGGPISTNVDTLSELRPKGPLPNTPATIAGMTFGGIYVWLTLGEGLIGQWEVVWGPGIFQSGCNENPDCADFTMYVAYNEQEQEYSICIAGTPACSTDFDWECINYAVDTTVPWEYGDAPDDACLARGASTGLKILQEMKDPLGVPGNRKTLKEFLENSIAEKQGTVKIVTNGISLGGALAPILALWLQETQQEWDPSGKASICSWPFAGYSTATAPFKEYADQKLEVNRVANTLDVVPLWWNQEDLEEISTLYTPYIEPDDEINDLAESYQSKPGDNLYYHLGEEENELILEGIVNEDIIDPNASSFDNFNHQRTYQHALAYWELLGLPIPLASLVDLVQIQPPTAKTRREQATSPCDECL